jgi:hypothetical protein
MMTTIVSHFLKQLFPKRKKAQICWKDNDFDVYDLGLPWRVRCVKHLLFEVSLGNLARLDFSGITVLFGGDGVGKTTVLNRIIDNLQHQGKQTQPYLGQTVFEENVIYHVDFAEWHCFLNNPPLSTTPPKNVVIAIHNLSQLPEGWRNVANLLTFNRGGDRFYRRTIQSDEEQAMPAYFWRALQFHIAQSHLLDHSDWVMLHRFNPHTTSVLWYF